MKWIMSEYLERRVRWERERERERERTLRGENATNLMGKGGEGRRGEGKTYCRGD